jgi:hypothetical protein
VAPESAQGSRKPLPAPAKRRLYAQAGRDAAELERIATSSALGAPQRPLKVEPTDGGRSHGPLGAAISAFDGGLDSDRNGHLLALFVALLAIAGSAIFAAVRQKRSGV